jgi:hypothetical protein
VLRRHHIATNVGAKCQNHLFSKQAFTLTENSKLQAPTLDLSWAFCVT